MFDYSYPLSPQNAFVRLVAIGGECEDSTLHASMAEAAGRFGFTFESGRIDSPPPSPGFVVKHLIFQIQSTPSRKLIDWAAGCLATFDTVSLAFCYTSVDEMLHYRRLIEDAKKEHGCAVNFIRPDVFASGNVHVSARKLVDNAVCDSVRVKYKANRKESEAIWNRLSTDVRSFFVGASELYRTHGLYFRAPSDGYFAIRLEEGFVITATKTCKTRLDTTRLAFVEQFDIQKNAIVFSGAFLPSSDAVEAAMVFSALPSVTALVHTHASDLFTRNPAYRDRVIVPAMSYGEPTLGQAIVDNLRHLCDGFLIMEEHGEIFANIDSESATFLARIESRCLEAAQTVQLL